MPLTHVYCAAPKHRKGGVKHAVSLDDCLGCAASRHNTCQFTYELLSSMFAQVQDRGDRISTTTLTSKCKRQLALTRSVDYAEEPEKMWPSFRGTMYHGQLELHAAPGAIEEARFHVDLDGLGPLSGSPDLVDVSQGILYDYKTTKEVPRFNYVWGDHVEQLNVNRWLVDHAHKATYQHQEYDLTSPEVRKMFVPEHWNDLIIVYIDDRGPKPISATRSEDVPKADGKGTKKVRVLDLWNNEKAENWIREKYAEAQFALDGSWEGGLPPVPDHMAGWDHPLCGWCPKKVECIDLHYAALPKGTTS